MDPEHKAVAAFNATVVRPDKFYISWFSSTPPMRYFFVFLCFAYVVTLLGNLFLLSVICHVKTLHTPKYMIICHLALTDLCASTAFIPRILETYLSNKRYILYEACLSSMFFIYILASIQSWTLVTMAYDRLIAICFPLRYHILVTKKSVGVVLLLLWGVLTSLGGYTMRIMDRLSFCRSVAIPSFFCDYTATMSLSCSDRTLSRIMVIVASVVFLCGPLMLILVSYICIGLALIRIASAQERLKAMKTCTSHLILVAVFFIPITVTTFAMLTGSIHPHIKTANACLTFVIPAMLNPLIYSLKTEEVLNSIKKLFRKNRLAKITANKNVIKKG